MWICPGGGVDLKNAERPSGGVVVESERDSESESEVAVLARWSCCSKISAWNSSDASAGAKGPLTISSVGEGESDILGSEAKPSRGLNEITINESKN